MNRKSSGRKYKSHAFKIKTKWDSGRKWQILLDDTEPIEGGSPVVFGGDVGRWAPEQLMIASIDSCHLASFVALCKHKDFEFVSYESENEGILEHDGEVFRFTKMTMRPKVGVKSEDEIERAKELVHKAHKGCFMSNTVNSEVTIEPEAFVVDDNADDGTE